MSHVTLMNETFVFLCAIWRILPRAKFAFRKGQMMLISLTTLYCNTLQHTLQRTVTGDEHQAG